MRIVCRPLGKILKFDDTLLKAFLTISKDVVAEVGARDELSKKIYASYEQFRASIVDWTDISERTYLNSRSLAWLNNTGQCGLRDLRQ